MWIYFLFKMIVIRTRKIEYGKIYQIDEQIQCNKCVIHRNRESALEMGDGGPEVAKNNKCDSGAPEYNDFADSENCDH